MGFSLLLATTAALLTTTLAQSSTSTYVEPGVPTGTPVPGNYTGPFRPQIHFSPPQHFMNDPNGLFLDANGTYHLYYQYDPTGLTGGNQHWGHATSKDLYHWLNQPIAIFPPNNNSQVFSGSAVVDVNNTSGFFPDQDNGVVAIYTLNTPTVQVQEIAYSRDGGFSFTRYEGNPVINSTSNQFRDPKVIWYEDHWVMTVAYATDFKIGFYTSPDLKTWTHASNYTHNTVLGSQYECPNLVKMPIAGTNDSIYLLAISINPGAPLGGSITYYLPGDFNGTHFTPLDDTARLTDFAKDNYAGQFFYGIPDSEEPISIAWASNWQYGESVPTDKEGWRSQMSLPHRNVLANISGEGLRLIQTPYDLTPVLGPQLAVNNDLGNGSLVVDYSTVESNTLYFEANFSGVAGASSGATLNFTLQSPASGESVSGAYASGGNNTFVLDRGNVRGFSNPSFTPTFSTSSPVRADGSWTLSGVVDRSIIEVFLNEGEAIGTAAFYATQPLTLFTLETAGLPEGASASVAVYAVESAWKEFEDSGGIVVGNVTTSS
ncbi:hypothetical protein OH77DRAFT_1410245 [Trametes cingulata]|nr:hypothetical protein OH77DRAFT_1410245 [Trametes cingulata]